MLWDKIKVQQTKPVNSLLLSIIYVFINYIIIILYVIIYYIISEHLDGENPKSICCLVCEQNYLKLLLSHIGHKQFETIERNEDSKQHKIEEKTNFCLVMEPEIDLKYRVVLTQKSAFVQNLILLMCAW